MDKIRYSGVAWLGDIPDGWEVSFLAQVVSQVKERNVGLREKNLLSLSYGKIKRKPIDTIGGLLPATFDGYNVIAANDIVLRLTDLQNDQHSLRVGLSHERGIITSAYITLRPSERVNASSLFYLLYAFDTRKGFYGMGAGVRQSLKYDEVKVLPIVLPPLSEQRAIADYLDEKCGAIDMAVAEAKKGIEEYKAWKKSLIFEVVTGKRRVGFFNAESQSRREEKMKSSGIPWIGEIPEGWKVSRVKNECDCLDYLREPISAENRVNEKALYDYYGASGAIDKIDDFNVDDTVLLIGEDGANLRMRNLPLVYRASGKIWVNNHAHILKVKPSNDYGFMAYALEAGDYNDFVTGSAQPKLTQTDLMAMPVVLPSLPEQQAIADYLDEKCAAIDAMVAEKEALIAELEAYKKSLIYETVTGKREVA